MKTYNLIDMADGKTPIPTEMVNIRTNLYGDDPEVDPRYRKLLTVEWRMKAIIGRGNKKFRWLFWTWKPNSTDGYDCGYSGMTEEVVRASNLYLTSAP